MKPGRRILGITESYRTDHSTLAGAVVRLDRSLDGAAFGRCTVGGTDVTNAILELYRRLDREDITYVMISGIALAWFNIVDLERIAAAVDRPTLSVTYEAGKPLEGSLAAHFDGDSLRQRRATLGRQPERRSVVVNDERVFVRSAGLDRDEADGLLRRATPAGGRPEPLRVARLLARAADTWAVE